MTKFIAALALGASLGLSGCVIIVNDDDDDDDYEFSQAMIPEQADADQS